MNFQNRQIALSCGLCVSLLFAGLLPAQPILPLSLTVSDELPLAGGQWDAAPLYTGQLAVVQAAENRIYFKLAQDQLWDWFTMGETSFANLVVEPNNTFAVIARTGSSANKIVERIPLPAAARGDTVVHWLTYTYSNTYGNGGQTSTYFRTRSFPGPPRTWQEISVEGHIHYWSYNYHYGWRVEQYYNRYDRYHADRSVRSDTLTFAPQYIGFPGETNLRLVQVPWTHHNATGWEYALTTLTIFPGSVQLRAEFHHGIADYPVTGTAAIGPRGACLPLSGVGQRSVVLLPDLVGGQSHVVVSFVPNRTGLLWSRPGTYRDIFAADVLPDNPGQEVACVDSARRCLDILDAATGQLLATTTPFEGNPADIKILGPEDPDFCYVAVRDGQTLRLYRFGEPQSVDLTGFEGRLPDRAELRISPEPVRGTLHLELSVPLHTPAAVVVYNILGREIARQDLAAATRSVAIRLDSQAAGIYFVRLENQPQISVKKFILIH